MIDDWKLAGWPVVRIRDIGRLHGGGTPSRKRPEYFQGEIPWITGQDIPDNRVETIERARYYVTEEAVAESATRVVPAGAVLITTRVSVGKTAVAGRPICFSQDVTALLVHSEAIALPAYVAHYLRSRQPALLLKNQGSTIAGITRDSLALEQIPLPPLSEQQRIVDILQEAEEIRRLRAQAKAKTAGLGAAIFASIFGAPTSWSGNTKLGDLVRIVGGGTPSKSIDHFFAGSIPWATSKDVKKLYLDDTQDHVTEQAIQSSATNLVPKGTLLVVVKSKILAHSLPMAITEVPMCFGQDLKGLIPHEGIAPEFLLYALNAQVDRVLSRARGANTEGLTLEALKSLPIPTTESKLISLFASSCAELKGLGGAENRSERLFLAASASLSAHAFTGQLTEDWRETNQHKLAAECRNRDAALQDSGAAPTLSRRATIQEMDAIFEAPTDGIYAELNREQRSLLREIERMVGGVDYGRYFTAEQLAADLKRPLQRHPQAIESHLAVFAVRGLVIPVSRPRNDSAGDRFAACYRLPLKEDDVRPERLEHQRKLAVGDI